MSKKSRAMAHQVAGLYKFESKSFGSGKSRHTILYRTINSAPPDPRMLFPLSFFFLLFHLFFLFFLCCCVSLSFTKLTNPKTKTLDELNMLLKKFESVPGSAFDGNNKRSKGKSGKQQQSAAGGQTKRELDGKVVGASASPISEENVGNRLLRTMGWSGGGLGTYLLIFYFCYSFFFCLLLFCLLLILFFLFIKVRVVKVFKILSAW